MNHHDEKILRDNIRHLIKHVKQKKVNEQADANTLIKKLMRLELSKMILESQTPDVDPTPNKSTGINVLGELLKKIIPVLETDYKSLTTNISQRESFRAHIANAVVNLLTPVELNNNAGENEQSSELQEIELDIEEDIDVDIDGDKEKFIDIRTDAEKAAEEAEEEEDPRDSFGTGVDGDETGRNMAYQCFKKIENNIIDSYELLANPEDQELFFDYLLANLKLYFDSFEDDLDPSVEEPTNQAYASAKKDAADPATDSTDDATFDLEI